MSHIQKHDEVFIYLDILIFLLTQVEYTQVFLMSSMRGSVDWYLQNTHILCFLIHPQNIHILCFLFHRQNIHILCFLIHPQHIHILGVLNHPQTHILYIIYISVTQVSEGWGGGSVGGSWGDGPGGVWVGGWGSSTDRENGAVGGVSQGDPLYSELFKKDKHLLYFSKN